MRKAPVATSVLGLSLLVAVACSGAPGGTGVPTLPPLGTISPLPTVAVQPDTALEQLFPDTVGGNTLTVRSATGEGVVQMFGTSDPTRLRNFISGLGATMDRVSAALSFNLWPGATATEFTGLTISALRVQGVAGPTTLAGLTELTKEDVENATVSTATIGGKSVTAISNPEDANENVYLYAWNDVVFLGGGTPAHVEEAFSKLP